MGDKTWTFRGDSELDPILKRWSERSEKSFHVRQALRQYLSGSNLIRPIFDVVYDQPRIEPEEVEVSFDEWG